MKKPVIILILICSLGSLFAQKKVMNYEKLSFDKGWSFHLGDIVSPIITGHIASYNNSKAGGASGAASPKYDYSSWEKIDLPHDWALSMPFDSTENLSQGYKKRGIGWYRRDFKLNPSDEGKYIEIQFDGISTHATIWVNGNVVHRNWCGYTSSYIDITPMVKYGDSPNSIVVRVDAVAQEGWWYEGAGIYRHTWLVKKSPLHIITDGVYANPVRIEKTHWEIPAEVTLDNSGKENSKASVVMSVLDKKGNVIVKGTQKSEVNLFQETVIKLSLAISNPHLWSIDDPYLYTVITQVIKDGVCVDELRTHCGFRTLQFTPNLGFYLNDLPVKLRGTCNHQDFAGVGVAVPNSLWEFRLRKLKEMGSNSYRCAHNPPSREFLDICDSMGMLVMDENRLFNTSPEYVRQLQWMVRRDRNHPSVILWSIFNEEPMQGTDIGYEMVRRLSEKVKQLDTTRNVTAAQSGGIFAPVNVSQAVDVVGLNYQALSYDQFHKEHPNTCVTSSEDVCCMMQRDELTTDYNLHLLDSYDTQVPRWGSTHRTSWKAIDERPFLAGCFVWSGFDYRGEPTPFQWPTVTSNFGIMDLCGFPKTAYYFYQAWWKPQIPLVHIVPHWNWGVDSIGKKIKVMVVSNVEEIKLFLNGTPIGHEVANKYDMNTWYVPFKPGKLEAIGYRNGKVVAKHTVETTGKPVRIHLIPYRNTLLADGCDAQPITVELLDSVGRKVTIADNHIEFSVSGEGKILGVGNGNPNSHESDIVPSRNLYHGLAQVIVQSADKEGSLTLTAKCDGIQSASITIDIKGGRVAPFVPITSPTQILDTWTVSPIFHSHPQPNEKVEDNDMNSWQPIKSNRVQTLQGNTYIVYRTTFSPHLKQQNEGGQIRFKKLAGKAEIWLNGQLLGTKVNIAPATFSVPFLPHIKEGQLNVILEGDDHLQVGLGGSVSVLDNSIL